MNRRGIVFLISLGVAFLLAVLGASMLMRSIVELHVTQRAFDQASAFQLADAGIDQAVINLRTADPADDILTDAIPPGTYTILSVVPIDALTQRVVARGTSGSGQRDIEAIVKLVPQSIFRAEKNSQIVVSGDVVVYAESVDFDKNLSVNEGGKPTQLLLNIYGSSDVVIDKEGTFVGGLYAPNSRVRLKKKDEAISKIGPAGSYKTSVIEWRDL